MALPENSAQPSDSGDGMPPTEGERAAEEQAAPSLDMDKLKKLAVILAGRFQQYEADRRQAEMRWLRNLRQYLGEYDPEILAQLGPNRSRAYPRVTRVKVISMVARLMNLLFPTSEKNYQILPSVVPSLPSEEMQKAIESIQLTPEMTDDDVNDMVNKAVREVADRRAKSLEDEIEDQLTELGGSRLHDYTLLCRKVLMSGVLYGVGVLKGPFVREVSETTYVRSTAGGVEAVNITSLKPQFEPVDLWMYYPDMTARRWEQMDGAFERHIMSRHQLSKLADREDFFGDEIRAYLKSNQTGNYKRRTFETELRTIGVGSNVNDSSGRKYEVMEWTGRESAHTMAEIGFEVPEEMMGGEVGINIWMVDGVVIKADLNPWEELEPDMEVNSYHHFVFEEDDTSVLGSGLPNIIRDSQMSIAGAARMLLDNASVVCGPNLEVNVELLRDDQDVGSVLPYKVWYRSGLGIDAQYPAVRNVEIESHIADLKQVVELFSTFADQESFVSAATGGDMQKGPSEPFRTAAGASMLRGDMALPFKDAVRNFDVFTLSVMTALLAFNRQFNPKPTIQGDFEVRAVASSSLVAKEVRGIQLDTFATTLRPEETMYVNMRELVRERAVARDLPDSVLVSDDEAKQRETSAAQSQSEEAQRTGALLEATVRKILADALKSLTQADKNAANAALDEAQAAVGAFQTLEGDLNGDGPAKPSEVPDKPAGRGMGKPGQP